MLENGRQSEAVLEHSSHYFESLPEPKFTLDSDPYIILTRERHSKGTPDGKNAAPLRALVGRASLWFGLVWFDLVWFGHVMSRDITSSNNEVHVNDIIENIPKSPDLHISWDTLGWYWK